MVMKIHTADDFADAVIELLPPGAAWDWQKDGNGYALIKSSCEEFARIDANIQVLLDQAIEQHRPKCLSWHITDYQRVANDAISDITEVFPRKTAVIGCHIGDRLWSINAPTETWPVQLIRLKNLVGPAKIGSRIGDRLWGHRSRYVLVVQYYRSVVDPVLIWNALMEFKQSHVFLWFEDITGVGGIIYEKN